ncbi:MAG: tetratricopeptide repeat protein [Bacteroidetes bacterium]|nr:tetratricopeptide repeat protein [Bacteroidota bacterium]MBS1741087.1 tetratricopeptide repeat protein [Bacteroidota bacterium]MBS1775411.1 tetratricopeptide repeat protein [Bacteroidota bacterium]
MTRICIIALSFIFFSSSQVAAENHTNQTWWQQANQLYLQKNYDSAIIYYQKIATHQPQNALVFFNLGNAYYKHNQIGLAVLNYERALRIDPDYSAAKDNLALTQKRIPNQISEPNDIFFIRWWKDLTKATLANVWAMTGFFFFIISLALTGLKRWARLSINLPTQLPKLLLLLSLSTLALAYVSTQRMLQHNKAVILIGETPLRTEINTTKNSLLLPEGTVLYTEKEQGNWVNVKLPDGRTGWVEKSSLEHI